MIKHNLSRTTRLAGIACVALLLISACTSSDSSDSAATSASATSDAAEATTTPANPEEPTIELDGDTVEISSGCEDITVLFVTRGSANADLEDPEVSASCDGDDVVVNSNGIPDYTYIETSPGQPTDRGHTFSFPSTPAVADATTAVPALGNIGVTLGGIPLFGPTEGTGGDVESLPGILSACGSHNGPSGFHIHLILTSPDTDCLFTPEEVAAEPQLVGYAFDGFPIYTGIDQFASSWQLTDEALFATDTWAAHSFVEGSGDLDQCNGLTDADGNYAYYTTATFPYVLGCYTGVVDLDDARGEGAGGGDGERPERPQGGDGDDDAGERPERPAAPEDGEELIESGAGE